MVCAGYIIGVGDTRGLFLINQYQGLQYNIDSDIIKTLDKTAFFAVISKNMFESLHYRCSMIDILLKQ